ncbi:sugar ABC transporter permease [Roseibium sp. CAU 1637]|uniref:Sugar ABC transporter permease n=1 Tax=Roseibium limicola TaxID=2816037 RepID=A0A939ENG3_9HYPH|nr:sugar ABC transporter permease [Roseibium limicola]MBO0344209.1 sugar ABC transporter permease [Roseibium limicola]
MRRAHLLGLGFMTPALIIVFLFFLAPVVLTAVFSFTSMSSGTGISGGAYEINEQTLRSLTDRGFPKAKSEKLGHDLYRIGEEGLGAVEADFGKAFADEIRAELSGELFEGRRDLERELKKLRSRPRSIRDLKKAADLFKRSVLNTRFESETAFLDGVGETGVELTADDQAVLVKTAYTGWSWTTANYELITSMASTWRAAKNTAFYVLLTLSFNVGFGLFLAITTFYLPKGQAAIFRAIWILPRILPPVLYVMMWKWLTWDTGFLSIFLSNFGVEPRNWMLNSDINAWVCIVLINGFVGASLGMILFSSALRAIPPSMLAASEVDGANRWQQIRHILLPQLQWPILFTTSYQTLSLLTSFDYIYLSTDGGPGRSTEVWALYTFHTALNNYGGVLQYGLGAALALVLVVIGIAASLFYLRLFKFNELVSQPRIEQ